MVRELSRRRFVALSAATVTGALVGRSRATEAGFTDRYAALLDAVDPDRSLPTLVRFDTADGTAVLDDLGVEYRTRADPPAGHARLTPAEAATVADHDAVGTLSYAPGSNPFWPLGADDDGVFPAPADAADYIAHEEALAGLSHLASAHPNRLRVVELGRGHGHESRLDGDRDRGAVWAAELTENVGAAGERETVVFEMGIHGDERAGVEAGLRFVEGVLTGDHPAVADRLSSLRLVFVGLNPDGWVVREPRYEDPVDPPDFRRFNGADRDLNRQLPTPGWIPPDRAPGEPRGATGTGEDPPERVATETPETLALVEFLRGYEDVTALVDFHGMYGHTEAVLALESAGGTPRDRAEEELLGRRIRAELKETLAIDDWTDSFEAAVADTDAQTGCQFDTLCQTPERLFGRGTTLDTIDYTTSGALADWATLPERAGGLDATALTAEVVFSNSLPDRMEKRFESDLVAFQVDAYEAVCRATVEHAAEDTGVTVETDGRSTAYLTSESLVRRAATLPHVGAGVAAGVGRPGAGVVAGVSRTGSRLVVDSRTATGGGVTSTVSVPTGTRALTVEFRAPGGVVDAHLRDETGAVVRAFDPPAGDRRRLTAVDPTAGEWRVDATALGDGPVEVRATRLVGTDTPDPAEVLGYAQRDYEVTPLGALDALGTAADGPVEGVTAGELRAGVLLDDGDPAYDNLVVIHDELDGEGRTAVEEYVAAGGNLVLTDSGLRLAGELEAAGLSAVDPDAVTRLTVEAAAYPDLSGAHPLVEGRRTTPSASRVDQREAWRHPPLGYARGEVPVYAVSEAALREAGATVASAADGQARLATVPEEGERTGVHLLGSVLPPATQRNLHPFGLLEHSLTTLGYLLLCNALGYRLALSRDGRRVATLGSFVDGDTTGDEGDTTDDGDDTTDANGGDGEASNQTTGADDDGPGFGPVAGVAGVGGLAYLLSRRGDPGSDSP